MRLKTISQLFLFLFFISLAILPASVASSRQGNDIQIFINNEAIAMDVQPVIENGRTLAPFRPILEALGARVGWSAQERKVTASRQDLSIILHINDPIALVGDKPVSLDVPPKILSGRTLIPVRFLAENLGAHVRWDGVNRNIYIKSTDPVSFSISPREIHLLPGQTHTVDFKAIFPPSKAEKVDCQDVEWSRDPKGIAQASGNNITALKQGETRLKASYQGLEAEVPIHVYPLSKERTTLLSRDGHGSIRLPEGGPYKVSVQKADKSYTFHTIPSEKERQFKITLPYREGTYRVDVSALENEKWEDIQQYLIYNPFPVSSPEDYLYQRGAFNTSINQPSATVDVVDSIQINGESDAEYFIFRIRHTDDLDNPKHFSHYFAAGEIDARVYLPLGEGLYHITIFASSTYEGTYRNTWDFFVNNKGGVLKADLIPTGDIQSDHPDIIRLADEITKGISREYNKSRAIHEWVAKNIEYDASSLFENNMRWEDNTALQTLKSRKAVCTGYSNLTAALHRAVGIPAVVIEGIARNTGDNPVSHSTPGEPNHAWNEVYVDGHWIILDTTWDAGYLDPETKEFNPDYRQLYFDPHPLIFSRTHTKI